MIVLDDLAKLAQLYPVLRELPASLQHAFSHGSYPVYAETGKIIIDAYTPPTSFLMLSEGSIRVLYPGLEKEFLLYRIQPGEVCILTACHLLTGANFQVLAEVESAIRGVALPQPLFRQMVEQSPLFCSFLFQSFAGRLSGLLELFGAVTTLRLDRRLAGLLLAKGACIKTTHSQLADELGSVREVISRILKDFEEKGFLKLERGQILILDQASLTCFHNFGYSNP
jgi:CRP/FNR family transcriptional regulator